MQTHSLSPFERKAQERVCPEEFPYPFNMWMKCESVCEGDGAVETMQSVFVTVEDVQHVFWHNRPSHRVTSPVIGGWEAYSASVAPEGGD